MSVCDTLSSVSLSSPDNEVSTIKDHFNDDENLGVDHIFLQNLYHRNLKDLIQMLCLSRCKARGIFQTSRAVKIVCLSTKSLLRVMLQTPIFQRSLIDENERA